MIGGFLSLFIRISKQARFARSATVCLLLLPAYLWLNPDEAAPVPVRFMEGAVHGFLVLTEINGGVIASGDLRQTVTSNGIEDRTIFRFKDGSLSDERVIFTQKGVFSMRSYQSIQRGPAFPEDKEISLDRGSGKYRVITKDHKGGKEKVIDGLLDLPVDVYNGMIFTIAKNLSRKTRQTVHVVAFTPEARIIQLDIAPDGEQKVMADGSSKTAIHYVLHPQLGPWLKLFTKLVGHAPPDEHVWILADLVPAFVKFEGPLYIEGPVWRIELTSPRPADAQKRTS